MEKKRRILSSDDSESDEDDEQEEDDTYEVEKILDKRTNPDGSISYLIKWAGYTDSENSWEPEENIENCSEALDEFEKAQRQLKKERKSKIKDGDGKSKSSKCVVMPADSTEIEEPRATGSESSCKNGSPPTKSESRTAEPKSKPSAKPAESETNETKKTVSSQKSRTKRLMSQVEEPLFDQGKQPEKIIGVTNCASDGIVRVLLQWEGVERPTFVKSRDLAARYPDMLIDFYESIIHFEDLP